MIARGEGEDDTDISIGPAGFGDGSCRGLRRHAIWIVGFQPARMLSFRGKGFSRRRKIGTRFRADSENSDKKTWPSQCLSETPEKFVEMSSELDVEKLIEAVRVRPQLWNKVDRKYRNPEYTNSLWREVCEEIGCSLTDAKQKWHNLRDCFRREVRFEHAGKKKRRWIYYNQMLFLLTPQFLHKFVRKNKFEGADTAEAEVGENEISLPVKTETTDDRCDFEANNSDSNNSELGEEKKGRSESTEDEASEECLTEPVAEELVIPDISEGGEPSGYSGGPPGGDRRRAPPRGNPGRPSRDIRDDDYHFAMSIVPYMRQVPLHRKLKMRIKITEILAEEYGYNKAPS